jgi:hypothetical protein
VWEGKWMWVFTANRLRRFSISSAPHSMSPSGSGAKCVGRAEDRLFNANMLRPLRIGSTPSSMLCIVLPHLNDHHLHCQKYPQHNS